MSEIHEVILLASAIVGSAVVLASVVAVWAHKQNQRNDPHRHHRGHTT